MELTLKNLTCGKEKVLFCFVLAISIIAWLILTITIVGLPFTLGFAVMLWFANGLFVAYLKSETVLVTDSQLPELYATYTAACEQFGLTKMPALYIAQAGGALNAFATRHAGRDFVVLFSDIVESYGQSSDEIKFLLGHEIGHIKNRHILKRLFLSPGLILPLLGPAYSRACETSCDRHGAFAAKNIDGAVKAMMILSGGKEIGKTMSSQAFSQQHKDQRGFFVSWHELISGYPTLSQRVGHLISLRDNTPLPSYSRNPLAYLFALVSFGGQGAGGSNFFITVIVIAMLAAIAIPNLLRARLRANDALPQTTLKAMVNSVQEYVTINGSYPSSLDVLKSSTKRKTLEYCGKSIQGYNYECAFSDGDYEFRATPQTPGASGSKICTANKNGLSCTAVKTEKD
ncbi:MAG: hypothetical protein A2Y00_01910 [Omnitrophica WOR_2 bacterium GWF2_43_52]|nr:MAG: hypothetical protein A2062_03685 [Omnitrophica WOR_2 bacterium GWA2_44_7]OGX19994.1 MAG: hypothetical protein A2Y00_01910 [Omnitrophica WOR_2 bacterium GWF2_43_52]HAH21361.1 hypothetical protein [Candidatus Omnitrophota bacterium]HBG63980.1 hypothetical protein [Candidatus Omnitrophota bacterium]HCD37575.1 hypothetical protein [Candidatus Omnitrophota bacterium]